MRRVIFRTTTLAALIGAGMAANANAIDIPVNANISTSTTWTSNNTYNLQQQIYVLPGATLTIEPGTVIASTTNIGGSLAVCKGAQIFVQGTQANPVIMTSTADKATWIGGDPKTGTWREAANEWGNLTVMGAGYISENAVGGNVPTPNANNVGDMEGLINGPSTDRYGGGNDDDDSGTITYLSLRYGGKVVGLNNELNGLSLGGIGRGTTIHHIDIMNNVDDGIEIWGGTVNLKYINIWNIGDDSFDIDQGWRGKAQFGLIVQGYSLNASQGSGVGDNCFETDGAEDSDWQPVSTGTIYNFTVIGQPLDGDHGTAWRDNARIQYRNCIFMDLGDRLVSFENVDGDGANGYGFNGTLSWAATWTTDYNAVPAHANDPANPAAFYMSQTSGKLAEMTDCVFFRNQGASAYTEATARGVLPPDATNKNVLIAGAADVDSPVTSLVRGPLVVRGGKSMVPVIGLDPRPQNEALTSVAMAPNDGFFTPAGYRGAFAPGEQSWLCEWTASYAFGYTTDCNPGTAMCIAGQGSTIPCPCSNPAVAPGLGCNNFGAGPVPSGLLMGSGLASVSSDTVVLNSSGENNTSLSVFFGGAGTISNGVANGGGVRCVSTQLKRYYIGSASGGAISRPGMADPSITSRATTLGVPISAGQTRHFYVAYRDPAAATPCGNTASTINTTNAYSIQWTP